MSITEIKFIYFYMTKNPLKLKKTNDLPFFGIIEKGDSLFTTISFLKIFIFFNNITSFIKFKNRSIDKNDVDIPHVSSVNQKIFKDSTQIINSLTTFSNICLYPRFITAPFNILTSPSCYGASAPKKQITFFTKLPFACDVKISKCQQEAEFISLKNKRLISNTFFDNLPDTKKDIKYDPNKNFIKIQKNFHKKNNFGLLNQSSFFLMNWSIFYFLPFWAVAFPINFFSNFYTFYITNISASTSPPDITSGDVKMLEGVKKDVSDGMEGKLALFNPSIFFSNYRKKIKTAITNNCKQLDNIQFLIILFPFVFSFLVLIRSRYKEQFFSYFVKETLPGFCLPHQNMSWETFNEIASQNIVSNQNFEQYNITDILTSPKVILEGDVKSDVRKHTEDKKKQTHFFNTPNNKKNFVASTLPKTMSSVSSTSPDLIERLDIYSNLILLEIKPVWAEQQKQLYINFLPKKKEMILKKLPVFLTSPSYAKQITSGDVSAEQVTCSDVKMSNNSQAKNGTSAFSDLTNPLFFTQKQNTIETNLPFMEGEGFTHQTKNNESETSSPSKLYAQKPSFLSFSKNKISLEKKSIDQKVKLNNVFSKQHFQQKFVDLDELPVKLDQNDSIDCDKTHLLNTLFNSNAKQNLPNLSNVEGMTDTFSLLSTKKNQQFSNITTSPSNILTSPEVMLGSGVSAGQITEGDVVMLEGDVENNQIDLILPFKSEVSSRFLSGYRFPDTERVQINSLVIQNVYKDFIFQKANKKNLKTSIQVPSSFVSDFLNENDSFVLHQTSPPNITPGDVESVTQLNFNYLPASQTVLNKILIEKSNIGGIYQKGFTTYKADQMVTSLTSDISKGDVRSDVKMLEGPVKVFLTPLLALSKSSTILGAQSFRESWEPVTFQSWLAITRLSFAFFVLKFLQYFYTTYGRDLLIVVLRFLAENLKERLGLTDKKKDKGYRLIKKVKKAFKDVAGIDNILPELGEMVWVLRNSGNGATTFKFGNLLPKGFLFVGPPGTGKTFLVQAIAGEAGVPVLVQSGSSLADAGENEKGARRLKNLFEKARQLAPCIVFIDEIDTLGETRQNVMRNPDAQQGTDDLIQSLHKYNQSSNILTDKNEFFVKPLQNLKLSVKKSGNIAEKHNKSNINVSENSQDTQKNQEKQKANQEQLNLLMQLLIELDGLKSRKGVIVIGATNRPRVLDPALTRPGRFDRVLNLEFPGKKKRIEILKLYSQNIGLASSDILTSPSNILTSHTKRSFVKKDTLEGDVKGFFYEKTFSSFAKEPLIPLDITQKNVKNNKLSAVTSPLVRSGRSANQLDYFFNPFKSLPKKESKEIQKGFLQTSNLVKPKNKKFFSKKNNWLFSLTSLPSHILTSPKMMLKGNIKSDVKEEMSGSTKLEFPWEYLANRTFGFSAADLAAAMNQSSIQAILRKTGHTIETIEQGIEFITSYSIEKPKIESQKSQETFSCLTSDLNSNVALTSPSNILTSHTKPSLIKKDTLESDLQSLLLTPPKVVSKESTKKGVEERLVKENKTFLQIPSLLFDVRLPKALSFQKSKDKKDPFFITRFAYYQAGKGVLHTLLPEHPDVIILKLWPQPKNSRHKDANFQLTSIDHRAKLETRLIGLYAGKAAELLFLCLNSHIKKENLLLSLLGTEKTGDIADQNTFTISKGNVSDVKYQIKKKLNKKVDFSLYEKRNLWHSNLGVDELSIASNLAHSLVDKWFFYSNKITLRKENQIFTNQNTLEFSKIELVDLFQQLTEEVQKLVSASNISESSMRDGRDKHFRSNFQEWSIRPWWQNQITKETGSLNMFYDDWYRIYLPDPEESERNEEWVIPDEYYHNTQNLKNILPFFGTKQSNQGNFDYGFSKNERATYPSNITKSDVCVLKQQTQSNHLSSNIAFGNLLLSDQKSCFFLQTHGTSPSNILTSHTKRSFVKEVMLGGDVKMLGKERKNIFQLDPDTSLDIKKNIKKQKILVSKNFQTKKELYVDITWNDLYKIDRDYIYHALILTCFNKAFSLLDDNRELLDYLADYLMRFETLRQHKIKEILCDFGDFFLTHKNEVFVKPKVICQQRSLHPKGYQVQTQEGKVNFSKIEDKSLPFNISNRDVRSNIKKNLLKKKQKRKFVFDKEWGINSRRKVSTFFSFDPLTKLVTSKGYFTSRLATPFSKNSY